MATIFMMNKEIARGMVCFFHQKKHSYLIDVFGLYHAALITDICLYLVTCYLCIDMYIKSAVPFPASVGQ
jgi:hypothetical protein